MKDPKSPSPSNIIAAPDLGYQYTWTQKEVARVIYELEVLKAEKKKADREAKLAEVEVDVDNLPQEEPEEKKGVFRLHAKSVFLTYPHTDDMEPEDLLACLEENFPDKIKDHDICKEDHKDGEAHLHALITFKVKQNIKNESVRCILVSSQYSEC